MAATREVYVTELQVDAKQGEAAIRQYETALGKAASAAERAARASDVAGNSIGQQSAAVRMVERSYQQTQRAVDRLVNRYDAATRTANELRRAEELLERATAKGAKNTDALAGVVERLRQKHEAAATAVNENARAMDAMARSAAAINQRMGIGGGQDYRARAADIEAYGRALDELQSRFDPVFAAQNRYQQELDAAADAHRRGALTAEQYAAAVSRIDATMSPAAIEAQKLAAAVKQQDQALDQLRMSLDAGYAANVRFAQAQQVLDAGLQRGAISADQYATLLDSLKARHAGVGVAANQNAAAMVQNETILGRITAKAGGAGMAFQGLGFQIADVAAQVSSGGNFFAAAGVQVGQFIGAFGPIGAVVGAAATIGGALAASMMDTADNTKEAKKALEAYEDAIDTSNAAMMTSTELSRSLAREKANEAAETLKAAMATEVDTLAKRQQALELQRQMADEARERNQFLPNQNPDAYMREPMQQTLDAILQSELRIADLQKRIDALTNPAKGTALGEDLFGKPGKDADEFAKKLESLTDSLDPVGAATRKFREDMATLTKAGKENSDLADELVRRYGEDLTAAYEKVEGEAGKYREVLTETTERMNLENEVLRLQVSGREEQAAWLQEEARLRDQLGPLYDQNADQLRTLWEENRRLSESYKAQGEAAKEAAEEVERQIREQENMVNSIVQYGGDRLTDGLFDGTRKGWQDMLEGMLTDLGKFFVRAAAEAALRPIAVSLVGTLSGSTALSSGGATGSTGGIGVGIGDLSSIGNLFSGSSSLYSAGEWIATSQVGQFLGMSSPTIASTAATYGVNAAEAGASIAAGQLAPAGGGALTGFGQTFAEGLSASPWGIVGSIGANLLFDDLNPVGSTIGGIVGSVGGGMAGSALLGSILGAAGGPVGAILGSFLGTALGGQFGGGKPHPGASYEATIGPDGRLRNPSILSKHMDADGVTQLGTALEQYTQALTRTLKGATLIGSVGATIDETEGRTALLTRNGYGIGLESHTRSDGMRYYDFDPKDEASQSRAIARLTLDLASNAEGLSDATRKVVDNLIAAAKTNEDLSAQTVDSALYLSQHWDEVMTQMRTGVVDLRAAIVDEAVTAIDTMIEQVETFQATVEAGYGAGSAEAQEAAGALQQAVAIFAGLSDAAPQMTAVEAQVAQLNARYAELPRLFEAVGHSAEEAAALAAEAFERASGRLRADFDKSIADQILALTDPAALELRNLEATFATLRREAEAVGGSLDQVNRLYDMQRQRIEEQATLARIGPQIEAVNVARANLLSAYETERGELESMVGAMDGLARSLRQSRLALLTDPNLSPLSPEARMDEAARQFADISSRARLGDTAAMEQLPEISRQYLEVARGFYASSEDYARIFDAVSATLQDTETVAERHLRIAEQQLSALNDQAAQLGLINDGVQSFADALAALGSLTGGTDRNWGANPALNQQIAAVLPNFTGDFGQGALSAYMQSASQSEKDRVNAILAAAGVTGRFADGGLAMPGLALVGERGPEVVDFRAPGRVYTNSELASALNRGGSDNGEMVRELKATNRILTAGLTAMREELAATRAEMADVRAKLGRAA